MQDDIGARNRGTLEGKSKTLTSGVNFCILFGALCPSISNGTHPPAMELAGHSDLRTASFRPALYHHHCCPVPQGLFDRTIDN